MDQEATFPRDVDKSVTEARTIGAGEKAKIFLITGTVVVVVIALLITPPMEAIGIPSWLTILGLSTLILFGFIYVYRYFIFKEPEKIQEMEEGLTDSFSKYCYIRNMDTGEVIKAGNQEVKLYELDNGNLVFYIKFLFGENSDQGTIGSRLAFESIFRILAQYRFEVSATVSDEIFSDSPEYKSLVSMMSNIKDPKLAQAMLRITNQILDMTSKLSSVETVTLRVKTNSTYQRYDIQELMVKIYAALQEYRTNFRKVDVLFQEGLLEYFKDFYCLEDIDLARMKIKNSTIDSSEFRKYVSVYQLFYDEGPSRTRKGYKAEQDSIKIAKKINL